MKTLIDNGTLLAALSGGIAVFVVSRRALDRHDGFGNPTVLALCTAVISFFGMLSLGPFILLPAGTLACTCLVLPLILGEGVRSLCSRLSLRSESRTFESGPRADLDPLVTVTRAEHVPPNSTPVTANVASFAAPTANARVAVRKPHASMSEPIIPLDIASPKKPHN